MKLNPIGQVKKEEDEMVIEIKAEYLKALKELEDFSHIQVIWWASHYESEKYRGYTQSQKPYKEGPDTLGLFATRSPIRPNPIMMTVCELLAVEGHTLKIGYIDAFEETPILDIKPYLPCSDKVSQVKLPKWASDWPESIEASASFDWSKVFNF